MAEQAQEQIDKWLEFGLGGRIRVSGAIGGSAGSGLYRIQFSKVRVLEFQTTYPTHRCGKAT